MMLNELRYRRVRWYVAMVENPAETELLRALLVERLPCEQAEQVDAEGQLTANATKWLCQLAQDVNLLQAIEPRVR
jgi:hypothetical protein